MTARRTTIIKAMKEKFNLNAVPAEEFYGSDEAMNGVWIRDDICKKESGWYAYAEDTMNEKNKVNKYAKRKGWYAEPYDAETIFFYPI